jgi:hypothetical protein
MVDFAEPVSLFQAGRRFPEARTLAHRRFGLHGAPEMARSSLARSVPEIMTFTTHSLFAPLDVDGRAKIA